MKGEGGRAGTGAEFYSLYTLFYSVIYNSVEGIKIYMIDRSYRRLESALRSCTVGGGGEGEYRAEVGKGWL